MPDSLEELLRHCTVRISTSAKVQGTGFFVAPGLVLTCAHVLKTEGSLQQLTVELLWNQQRYPAQIEQIRNAVYPDIALLRTDCPDHPCVHMDEDIKLFDQLYSYGYSDEYPNGESVTLEYEGPTDEQSPLLKLKEGQIRPAESGAPLLNVRTRRVCGIVKLTRDRAQPMGGRAIPAATIFQEFEQVRIAQQQLPQGYGLWGQNPTHLAQNGISYVSLLTTFLRGAEGRWFQHDFEQGRIYVPEKEYFAKLETLLAAKHRALLSGLSAAGKTMLALSFAKHLQERAGYIVCYKDVKQAGSGDGRKWYALMRMHDRSGLLYILDNCHLAPGEIDEFCRQWQDQPPVHTQCLLISRTNQQEGHQAEEGSYFQTFSDDEKLQVRSEDIFWQIIEQYVTTLSPQDSNYSIALQNDDRETLTKHHAHNLVVSRSRLDAWQMLGAEHRLSEVRQKDTCEALEKKYLSVYGTALATLCILQCYEIRVHTRFVEQELSLDEVKRLQAEKLLIRSGITAYGHLYDLVLHPSEARELFMASVFDQYGYDATREDINQLVISTLEKYLQTGPPNFITVYESLARQRQEAILKHLLSNHALQEQTISQFNKETVLDALRYTYRIAKFDPDTAAKIMKRVVKISDVEGICAKLLKHTFQDIALLLHYVYLIDSTLARSIADALNVRQLAQQAKEESIQSLFRLVYRLQALSPSQAQTLLLTIPVEVLIAKTTMRNLQDTIKQLQAYNYAPDQLERFVELLAMPRFAQQSESLSLQKLFWTLHTLEKVSSTQAQTLLACISPQALSMKASASNLGSLNGIVHTMRGYGYSAEQVRTFVEGLDTKQVAHRAKQGNLRRLTALLRSLKPLSASAAMQLLEMLTPGDIAALFQRSPLSAVGDFLQYQYAHPRVRAGYALFQEQSLQHRLDTEPLSELSRFLDTIYRIRPGGQRLAHHALTVFVATDMTERIALADPQHFALLLQYARSIDKAHFPKLLAPLRQPPIVQAHLARSDLQTMQRLIFNVATLDEAYLPPIRQALSTSNISERLEVASVRDIGLFLWNVYRYIDKRMAQDYTMYVDQHLQAQQFKEASPQDICFFLWNLTSISDTSSLQSFDEPVIQHLLLHGWHEEIGWSAVLAGIAAIAQAPIPGGEVLAGVQIQAEALSRWFTASSGGRNPYFLALALHGLRAHNEEITRTLASNVLPLSSALDQLESARASAITPRSITLIEGTQQWLYKLLDEE